MSDINQILNSIVSIINFIVYLPLIIAFINIFIAVVAPEFVNMIKEILGEMLSEIFEI